MENLGHYFTSVWDECNCAVVRAFFGIAFLWDWNENWPFPVLCPLLSFPNLLANWVQHIGKDCDAGRDWGQEEKGTTEDEMAGWHHRLNGREFEWTPGDGDRQGGLACCDSWGRKESDTTERLNWTESFTINVTFMIVLFSDVLNIYLFSLDNKKFKAEYSFGCVMFF